MLVTLEPCLPKLSTILGELLLRRQECLRNLTFFALLFSVILVLENWFDLSYEVLQRRLVLLVLLKLLPILFKLLMFLLNLLVFGNILLLELLIVLSVGDQ
jgi:hypothetical protein